MLKRDHAGGEVDEDGVHADDDEEKCPVPEAEDIDDEVKEGEEEKTPSSAVKHEGGSPHFFDDGEFHRPEMTDAEDE